MLTQFKTLLKQSAPSGILSKNSPSKQHIRQLQQLLYELGFGRELKWSEFGADGSYGSGTVAAVKAFAEKNGISADGSQVSREIAERMVQQYELASAVPVLKRLLKTSDPQKVLHQGSGNKAAIVALQTMLHLAGFDQELKWATFGADGDYGAATAAAVTAYAKKEDLDVPAGGKQVAREMIQKLLDQWEPLLRTGDEWPVQPALRLGCYDEEVPFEDIRALLELYHRDLPAEMDRYRFNSMRNGDLNQWVELQPVAGKPVQQLQNFLVDAGIMHPTSNRDGVFAYATQAGVRLFQEYVRIYEGKNLVPTGIVDRDTEEAIRSWQKEGKTADKWPRGQQSEEYRKWMAMMKKARDHYRDHPHLILEKVSERVNQLNSGSSQPVDTIKIGDWTFNEDDIHLIGIRRKEKEDGSDRENDDLFVLLINGMVFKFWGSTDPNANISRSDEAFLAEGQHKFRFGWHHASNKNKLYQGLEPFHRGVLVFRDRTGNNRLTEADIEKGLDQAPNTTINIHWTGIGDGDRATWSAGCQVIAGKSYIDPLGNRIDCASFAALGNQDLKNNVEEHITKTKAAYNVFCDLLLVYPPRRVDYLIYSLGRDETLTEDFLMEMGGRELLAGMLDRLDLRPEEGLA